MAKKASAKKKAKDKYTKPDLREKIKDKVKQGDKGGRAGQWSARKAQLLSKEYKKQGGGFTGEKDESAKHLDQWTDEKWTTSDGKPARRGKKKTSRYLPKKAWEDMSPAEKKATSKKKEAGSAKGKQYVSNTKAAKASRKKNSKKTSKKTSVKKKAGRKTSTTARKKSGRPSGARASKKKKR